MNQLRPAFRRGLTVIEVAIGAVLVATLVIGSLQLLGGSLRMHTTVNDMLDGPMLAEQLLAEIMSNPYGDPEEGSVTCGVESGEGTSDRLDFDDVDDYDGWTASPPTNKDGTAITAYTGWTRLAAVVWVDASDGAENSVVESGQKRISVTVTSPSGRATTRYAFRTRWGALEQPPTADSTVVTNLQSSLETGTRGARADWSSNLINHVVDPNAN